MTSLKIMACCASFALSSMAIPASAAHVITITGQYSISDDPNSPQRSALYRYIYDPKLVVTTGEGQEPGSAENPNCVYDCRDQRVPVKADSGKIGSTTIPYHHVDAEIYSDFDGAPSLILFITSDAFPYVMALYQPSGSYLDQLDDTVEYYAGGYFEVVFPGGTRHSLSNPQVTIEVVPEPATWLMLLIGFGALGAVVRRNRVSLRYASS